MNKSELVEQVAGAAGLSQKQAGAAIDAALAAIQRAVSKGDDVAIPGFGKFERRRRSKRKARNLQTGKAMTIPATNVPAFKPGQGFKEVVAGKRSAPAAKKPAAKKPAAKKPAAKKPAAKKPAAKKPAAKKPAAKKPAAKKPAAKKPAAKKPAAKKPAAKKPAAKKPARKR
ncbi:MAG: DNA-binding protein [Acidobacteria bacterium]|nr:MAG: DNA-binding protein [Acidobacteriota bacterium]